MFFERSGTADEQIGPLNVNPTISNGLTKVQIMLRNFNLVKSITVGRHL